MKLVTHDKCYACDATGNLLFEDLQDFQFGTPGKWSIFKCNNSGCGLMWLNPRPENDDLYKLYENYYTHGDAATPHQTDHSNNTEKEEANNGLDKRQSFYENLISGLVRYKYRYPLNPPIWAKLLFPLAYLNPIAARRALRALRYTAYLKGGSLLDIGCGEGNYVKDMKDMGWEAYGLDFDEKAIQAAQKQGLNAKVMDAAKFGYEGKTFDVITVHHVLEHVPDPSKLIRNAYDALKPGGVLKIFVPNQDSLSFRLFNQDCFHLDPPRHLYHYNLKSLALILEKDKISGKMKTSSVSAYWNLLNSITTRKLNNKDSSAKGGYSLAEKMRSLAAALVESVACSFGSNMGEQIEVEIFKEK